MKNRERCLLPLAATTAFLLTIVGSPLLPSTTSSTAWADDCPKCSAEPVAVGLATPKAKRDHAEKVTEWEACMEKRRQCLANKRPDTSTSPVRSWRPARRGSSTTTKECPAHENGEITVERKGGWTTELQTKCTTLPEGAHKDTVAIKGKTKGETHMLLFVCDKDHKSEYVEGWLNCTLNACNTGPLTTLIEEGDEGPSCQITPYMLCNAEGLAEDGKTVSPLIANDKGECVPNPAYGCYPTGVHPETGEVMQEILVDGACQVNETWVEANYSTGSGKSWFWLIYVIGGLLIVVGLLAWRWRRSAGKVKGAKRVLSRLQENVKNVQEELDDGNTEDAKGLVAAIVQYLAKVLQTEDKADDIRL